MSPFASLFVLAAVLFRDGFDYCEGHAMAYGAYENGEV